MRKNTKNIAYLGIFVAIAIIVGRFMTIPTMFLRISFMFIPMGIAGYMFGPIFAGTLGLLQDILNFIIWPTGPFTPLFTISAILTGVIYGIFLYKKKLTVFSILVPVTIICIVVDTFMNTYWLQLLYGSSFIAILPARFIKSLISIPLNTVMLYYVIKMIKEQRFIKKIINQ